MVSIHPLRVISLRILFGIMLGGLFTSIMWGWRVNRLRAQWQHTAVAITAVVEKVAGGDPAHPLDPSEAAARVELIGRDRDTARHSLSRSNFVLARQTLTVRAYEAETKRLRAISADQVSRATVLVQQRDHWIVQAQQASTRTARAQCEQELRMTEEALDALYQADF